MCGIIGYKGHRNAIETVVKGLKTLEYRGYDSWGVALKYPNEIKVVKKVGKIGNILASSLGLNNTNIAIGHTRWSTHGIPSDINAHPHLSSDGNIAVVHNGIIENYKELRLELEKRGYVFKSQTDTEVIPHLIEEFSKELEFEEAVKQALKTLEGTYAIVVINNNSDKIIAARHFSPLVLGIGNGEYFIASDVPAFIEYTKDVIFVNDNEMVILNNNLEFINFETNEKIKKQITKIEWDIEQAQKGEYPHFMLKEIFEQPNSINDTLRGRIKANKVFFEDFKIDDNYLKSISRIVITACGTSWHSGLVGKYIIESLAKIPVEVDYASEFRYRNPVIGNDTLIIAISQSGETADTLAAIREAKSKGAKVLSICNVIGSSVPRESDATIYTRAGIEIGVASTKAFTSQLTILYLLGVYFAQLKQTWPKEHLAERIEFLQKIPEQIKTVLESNKNILECAKCYYAKKNALYLGRGTSFPIALEGALKLKEVSYLHAEGYPAAEMKHGPIALIDNEMPVFVIAVQDNSYTKIKNNIEEVRARGGKVIAIATEGDEEIKKLSEHALYVPKTSGLLYPFLTVVPFQLIAYHIANLRKCDIDRPRSLAKAVCVE